LNISLQFSQKNPTETIEQVSLKDINDSKQSDNDYNNEPIIFVESKVPKCANSNGAPSSPMVYNKYSSCTIKKNAANFILEKMCELLTNYSNEIDFVVSKEKYTIEGVIFIRNRPISWIITIWEETTRPFVSSKVEFQKRRGDCACFQLFWSDMLNKIDHQFGAVNVEDAQRCNNFENLFMPMFDFCKPMEFDEQLLNNLKEQLDDDYHETALDALTLLCSRLESDIEFRTIVSKHDLLMETLTQSVLTHVDSNHVRGALKALQLVSIAKDNCMEQLISKYQTLNIVIQLLQHYQTLIRKHAVRLLALLSQKVWDLTNNQCLQIEEQLKKLQNEWNISVESHNDYNDNDYNYNQDYYNVYNDNEFVSWKMF